MAELLTQSVIAEYLNVDVRQIRNLVKKGLPVRQVKGTPKYPWPAGLQWYVDFKIQDALKRAGGGEADRWRARRERAAALSAELDLARRRGALLDLPWVLRQAERWLTITRSFAANLGPGLSVRLAGVARGAPEVQALIDRETDDFLRDLQAAIDGLAEQAQSEATRGEGDDAGDDEADAEGEDDDRDDGAGSGGGSGAEDDA